MIKSWHSFLITVFLLCLGFFWTTNHPDAPYQTFATALGAALAAYLVKRSYGHKLERDNGKEIPD